MLCLFIIIKNAVYLQECFAAFLWGSENYIGGWGWDGLLNFSRLIYCGRSLFIRTSAVSPISAVQPLLIWLLLEGKDVVYPKHGWY